jgi:myo-inositol-1(or 4)-monophosphatase
MLAKKSALALSERRHESNPKNHYVIASKKVMIPAMTPTWLTETFNQARQLILQYHASGAFWSKDKGPKDVLTEVDLALEQLFAKALARHSPNTPLLSEETPQSHLLDLHDSLWVLDPLDGTMNFSHGFPFFAISLARIEKGELVEAWIDVPALDERLYAAAQKGAFCNGRPISVSPVATLDQALLVVSRREKIEAAVAIQEVLKKLTRQVQSYRRTGSAVFNYTRIAMGQMDVFLAKDLGIWDMAAGHLLVREAGGQVLTWEANPHEDLRHGDIIAGSSVLLAQVQELFTSA